MDKKDLDTLELGIDLRSKKESQLFKWLLVCLLFGKPIQATVAIQAYKHLIAMGITSLDKLAKTNWDELVKYLDESHYVRYDYSTASKLILAANTIKKQYGSVRQLLITSQNAHNLDRRLEEIKGIGPITSSIFLNGVIPIWFKEIGFQDYDAAYYVAHILNKHGFDAYIIGGAVRDLLLNRTPKDFDIVTNALPEQITSLDEFTNANYSDTAQAYGVTRVRFMRKHIKYEIEVATFRKDIQAHRGRKNTRVIFTSLEDDVLRRDLTINALALDLDTHSIIDYVDGIGDLTTKKIRYIGRPYLRIKEDPLRMLRAIRLKNSLEFDYDSDTIKSIKNAVRNGYTEQIATDRIRDELTRMFIDPSREQAIIELDSMGILVRILPEVVAGKGIAQPPQYHGEGDVWQHQLLIMRNLPNNPSKRLAWAALLHDIGKPLTITKPKNINDRIRFNRHYAIGAELAKTVLSRLRFSNHEIKEICWMIYNHLAIDDLPTMRISHQRTMLNNPAFEDLLELHRADAAASVQKNRHTSIRPRFKEIERIWHNYLSQEPASQHPTLKHDLGIDGEWVITNFSTRYKITGPIIGKLLKELEEWYQNTNDNNKMTYFNKAKNYLELITSETAV